MWKGGSKITDYCSSMTWAVRQVLIRQVFAPEKRSVDWSRSVCRSFLRRGSCRWRMSRLSNGHNEMIGQKYFCGFLIWFWRECWWVLATQKLFRSFTRPEIRSGAVIGFRNTGGGGVFLFESLLLHGHCKWVTCRDVIRYVNLDVDRSGIQVVYNNIFFPKFIGIYFWFW